MGKKKDQKKISKRADEGFVAVAPAEVVGKPAEKKPVKRTKAPAKAAISTTDIALRAYFISEKRRSEGLDGNEHLDWLEAERQLVAEKKAKKKPAEAK